MGACLWACKASWAALGVGLMHTGMMIMGGTGGCLSIMPFVCTHVLVCTHIVVGKRPRLLLPTCLLLQRWQHTCYVHEKDCLPACCYSQPSRLFKSAAAVAACPQWQRSCHGAAPAQGSVSSVHTCGAFTGCRHVRVGFRSGVHVT